MFLCPTGVSHPYYFFYFAALGVLVPFWGLYLRDRGFSPLAVGDLIAILMATKILAPTLWGWVADHVGVRLPIVHLASLLSLLAFSGIFVVRNYSGPLAYWRWVDKEQRF